MEKRSIKRVRNHFKNRRRKKSYVFSTVAVWQFFMCIDFQLMYID